jgi:alkanesulfonate monooxygenase SsuD/methylene tetrahydromethanopterin reductase-like flavin-dependent oxidoreductase (luciferase family)
MPDYGHDLRLGTFITPRSESPQDVVALAQLADRVGYDLVTVQDHPYQPAFLDAWTLLAWIAATTERVHVASNVLNLPLRPPAVLARAAASLDRLSGGRFELGLGSGFSWDAIAAMGGPRRTPGEGRRALEEAIDVIRAIWAVDEPGPAALDGRHYRVSGVRRGPRPAHDIAVWLGAYRPRMLQLVGAKADGWLPGLPLLQPGDLPRGNAIIDAAAADAGRDPRAIRRLLNVTGTFSAVGRGLLHGPPSQWAQELAAFALQDGVSTFVLMADDPAANERFAAEVAPALREAVARERAEGAAGPGAAEGVRRPKALALRREGIDYDGVPEALRETAVEPGDPEYPRVRSTYVRRGAPGLVLRPADAGEVAQALAYAREQDVTLAIRSGGHGISGRSTNDGGIVLDLGRLDEIAVIDPARGRFRAGPGARWGHVARALAPHGRAMSSGDWGDVGVGGLATTGGIGLLGRRYGLTIDHLAAVEVVLADGTRVRADAEHRPDLFWAVRGAGANVGIVTAFEIDAYPLGAVVRSTMVFAAGDLAGLLERWGALLQDAPRALTSFLTVFAAPGEQPAAQVLSVYAGDDAGPAIAALTPLLALGPLLDEQTALVPYAAVVPPHGAVHAGGVAHPQFSNGFVGRLTPGLTAPLAELLRSGVAAVLAIRSVGGAVNDVPPQATAYAHRHQRFNVTAVGAGRTRRGSTPPGTRCARSWTAST